MDNGARESIFLAVAETLMFSAVNLDEMVEMTLDAEQLKRHFLANPRAIIGFSQNEKSLYERAIGFASASLIELLPQVAGFDLSVTRAMLRQNQELLRLVRSQKELEFQKRDEFLKRYRQRVSDHLDKADAFGVRKVDKLLSAQKLCDAYVQLSVKDLNDDDEVDEIKSQVKLKTGSLVESESYQILVKRSKLLRQTKNVEEVLSKYNRFIVRGGAGAGKTSLMRWLAVHTARQDFAHPLQSWNSLVPFFIQLRTRVDKGFPPVGKEFIEFVATNIAEEMPTGWVREILERGSGLVLIDGVDELPIAKR